MKNFKKFTLGILGATILSAGLYSCSNDDTTTTSTSTEQITKNAKAFADVSIIPGGIGLGFASSYAGPCVPAKGFCIDFILPGPGTHPFDGIGRVDDVTIRLVMSIETYQNNIEYLSDNIFEVGDDFSLAQEVSTELGFETETIVSKQTAEVIQANDEGYYIDLNVKQN